MKVVAIIQARMGSTRLPNKMMLYLGGYPVIEWVYQRVKKARRINQVVVAIPDLAKDQVLEYFLGQLGAEVFKGSENDLVERFYHCARYYRADHIVRVCADNPLVDPGEIDRLVEFFQQRHLDYAYNHVPLQNQYPDGLGAEVTTMGVLQRIYEAEKTSAQHEHLFNFLHDNKDQFNIETFDPPGEELRRPDIKLDLDTSEDYLKLLKLNYSISDNASEIVRKYGALE